MARIKIKDLPKDMKISSDELKRVRGGSVTVCVNKSGSDVTMAFPDVCKTPAPPMPFESVPYPTTTDGGTVGTKTVKSESTEATVGTKTVKQEPFETTLGTLPTLDKA